MSIRLPEVIERVAELRKLVGVDDEAACAGAEELRIEVLQAISNGAPAAIALAKAAMVTVEEDIGGD